MSPRTLVLPLALVGLCASPLVAAAQQSTAVAYVYVSGTTRTGGHIINGYYTQPNGSLTPMTGSPYGVAKCKVAPYCGVGSIALNGKWLFGSDGYDIDVFSMAADGALKQTAAHPEGTTSGTPPLPSGGPANLFLDHTGATLYDLNINLDGTENNGYQAFRIDQQNGDISLINQTGGSPSNEGPLTFIGNNEFAYSSSCYHGTVDIYSYQRMTDGGLAFVSSSETTPTPPSGDYYCPYLAAADPTDHLAVAVQPTPNGDFQGSGPYQIAAYTANTSTGKISTTNTYANMPSANVGQPYTYWLSPDGKYIAVGGQNGLQLFHWNGAAPATKFTGVITTDPITQLWWDNEDHLYALSQQNKVLLVYNVTPAGAMLAPGSPHAIAGAAAVMALPKTKVQ